ncbi:MAG: hypothetical protein K2G10_00725 [Alistipes sp.]|nr:hypothetical protein [Alistipes sp.]
MPGYEVAFEVAVGEQRVAGSYAVEGERYYLTLGDAEVFADAATRYEADRRRREVTVAGVEAADRNLLNDPIHAFDFLDSGYRPALLWERGSEAAVSLTPAADAGALAGRITLVVDTRSMQPRSVAYDFDGETILISVLRVGPLARPFPAFDRTRYAGFEWIDFR